MPNNQSDEFEESKGLLGQRVWFSDGTISTNPPDLWSDMPEDGVLVRMLYYADGTRQIQHGLDHYYESLHHSGETIRGAGMDKDKIAERYPGAIIKQGAWSPDQYYRTILEEAMSLKW